MSIIRDAGTGVAAHVNGEGKLQTTSVDVPHIMHHTEEGDTFMITTDFVTSSATADDSRSMFYLKNTSTTKRLFMGFLNTASEVSGKWIMVKNPTSISNSTAIGSENAHFSDSTTVSVAAEKGGATSDTTGGTAIGHWIQGAAQPFVANMKGSIVLGPNDSIAIEFAPFAAAAGEVSVAMLVWADHA